MYIWVGWRLFLSLFALEPFRLCSETGSITRTQNFLIQLDSLAQELQGWFCLWLPSSGDQAHDAYSADVTDFSL